MTNTLLKAARKRALVFVGLATALLCAPSVGAQEMDHSQMHAHHQTAAADARQALDFPEPMRNHMLSHMRAHLEAVGEVLAAIAANDPAKAAELADTRLGLASPDAATCRRDGSAKGMAAMMGERMPEPMRAMGMAMHQSASNFAEQARHAKTTGDLKPALSALAEVTQNCAACHSAYRLK